MRAERHVGARVGGGARAGDGRNGRNRCDVTVVTGGARRGRAACVDGKFRNGRNRHNRRAPRDGGSGVVRGWRWWFRGGARARVTHITDVTDAM